MPKPPQLGIFLTESMQPLKFDPASGMIVRLDDARQVRIDPLTLEATPYIPIPEGKKPATADRKAVERTSNGMDWRAMVRGVAMERPGDDMDWLGLLAETELAAAKERKAVSNQMDFTEPRRHRPPRGPRPGAPRGSTTARARRPGRARGARRAPQRAVPGAPWCALIDSRPAPGGNDPDATSPWSP